MSIVASLNRKMLRLFNAAQRTSARSFFTSSHSFSAADFLFSLLFLKNCLALIFFQ